MHQVHQARELTIICCRIIFPEQLLAGGHPPEGAHGDANVDLFLNGVCPKMNLNVFSVSKVVHGFDSLTGFIHRWVSFGVHACGDFRFMVFMAGKARRFFLVHFNKSYIQQQLLHREGDCRQCGVCCNLLFTCPVLTKKGRCLIYGVCRPGACKVFPIDQRDIDEVKMCGGECGYGFLKTDLSHAKTATGSYAASPQDRVLP
jgi:hypothetical protein